MGRHRDSNKLLICGTTSRFRGTASRFAKEGIYHARLLHWSHLWSELHRRDCHNRQKEGKASSIAHRTGLRATVEAA